MQCCSEFTIKIIIILTFSSQYSGMNEVRNTEKNSNSENVAYSTQYVSHLVSSAFVCDSIALIDTYAG